MAFDTLKDKRNKIFLIALFVVVVIIIMLFIVIELIMLNNLKDRHPAQPTGQHIENATATPGQTDNGTEVPATEEPTFEPWIMINEGMNTIETRFNPPRGYTRVAVEKGSFAEYLRTYPLKEYGEPALLFSRYYSDDASTLGVFDQYFPISQDQQCADTVIMLWGEYLFKNERFNEIVFNYASGFKSDFVSWAKGYRDKTVDGKLQWVLSTDKGAKANDYSYDNFYAYLLRVYAYANTDSVADQFRKVNADDLKIGDFLVGTARDIKQQAYLISPEKADEVSYGHAIIIADMAVNEKGEKVYLFIEGTTPATECCVVENPDGVSGCWYKFNEDGTFVKGTSGILWLTSWGRRLE